MWTDPKAPTILPPRAEAAADYRIAGAGQRAALVGRDNEDTRAGIAEGKFSFKTILDTINPLQHIPGVSALYRELTGETIGPAARMAGGALFGGAIGFVVSAVNAVVEGLSGKDLTGHLLSLANSPAQGSAALPKSKSAESYRQTAENISRINQMNRVDTIG